MKKTILLAAATILLLAGCRKHEDAFAFKGVVCGYQECTLMSESVSSQDFGYYIALSSPDSIGKDYYGADSILHHNTVLLYSTRTRLKDGAEISGKMYLDADYSKAYCTYHSRTGIPEAVCYRLD